MHAKYDRAFEHLISVNTDLKATIQKQNELIAKMTKFIEKSTCSKVDKDSFPELRFVRSYDDDNVTVLYKENKNFVSKRL